MKRKRKNYLTAINYYFNNQKEDSMVWPVSELVTIKTNSFYSIEDIIHNFLC